MKKSLYIFRHGQTEWNKLRKAQGTIDIPLTSFGVQQATKIPQFLKDKKLGIIYSSHLKRAWKTGEIVAKKLGIDIVKCEDLREGNFGIAQGENIDEMYKKLGDEFKRRWRSGDIEDDDFGYPKGETKLDMRKRVVKAMSKLTLESPHMTIGFASHGFVMKQLAIACDRDNIAGFYNCEIAHLVFDTDKYNEKNPQEAFSFIERIKTNEH